VTVTQTATTNVKHKYCATSATLNRQPSQNGKLHQKFLPVGLNMLLSAKKQKFWGVTPCRRELYVKFVTEVAHDHKNLTAHIISSAIRTYSKRYLYLFVKFHTQAYITLSECFKLHACYQLL